MTTTDETRPARPAGRPRSARAEKAIIEATLDLISESVSLSELSIEAVAARAGVGKTTIYRRWSSKEDLVVDALATLKAPIPPLEGRTVREDLAVYLEVIGREACDVRSRCVMNIAMNEAGRHPQLVERIRQAVIKPRREALGALLRRGIETGELRPDLDLPVAMATVVGSMMWYVKSAGFGGVEEHPEDLVERMVDHLMAGLAPR
ncbi:TetR family transcriptional regulator [Planomonospora parontospora subsp. parontospora]|uniref:TetR family transcriptional regulator n=2 Tax=Planomonospora parontospora TaxID=58119 RepID=A0AA37BBC5_9ACTN|nr:TetR/AcrR family transcriptional regulator [Planomonospora parontospora]GGK46174.1 TetR family transcriptional regulator [Planomonospora parontospora]GII06428.1 TetR family transcriptional regulator [Planomonospora parontospora subsp. parontospora]